VRIAFFTDTEAIGGAERHLADLAAGVAEAGHDAVVLAPQDELLEFVGATSDRVALRRTGTRAHHGTGGWRRGAALGRGVPSLIGAVRAERPALLHVNNGGYPGSDLCRLAPIAGRIAGVSPRLMTVNSMPWPRGGSVIQAGADALVWNTVDAVLFPSVRVGEAVIDERRMPRRLMHHLRYGVREPAGQADAPELRSRLLGDGRLLAGMVSARPVPEKGYDVFLDALAAAGPDVHGVIVGPFPQDAVRTRINQLGLTDRLTLTGPVPAVGAYHHAIDVLVMPSTREEAMPLVILEAMAAARPVFASRLAGTPEAVVDGETGTLFAPGDAAALGELLTAAEPDLLARMGAAGQSRWRELFSPDALIRSHLDLYEGLVRNTESR
jgi:glycosyltransferase involved in cell wall biosynthesis